MSAYFGSLIRQTGLSVASRDPRPFTGGFGEEGNGPHAEFGGLTEETVEIAAPHPEPVFDARLPRWHAPEGHESLGVSGGRPELAESQAQESIASRYEEWETQRAGSRRESRVEERTGLEKHVQSTVPRVPTAEAARVHLPMGGETPASSAMGPPDAPPPVEQRETRESGDSGSGESPVIKVVDRESKGPPENSFERAQVWREAYQLARDWVAASPFAEEVPEAIERHDFLEAPKARPTIISPGIAPAPAAAEISSREPSAVPEIHVSIGTISVVVEEPAAKPQAPQPETRQGRQEPAAPPDWTRLRRLYIR